MSKVITGPKVLALCMIANGIHSWIHVKIVHGDVIFYEANLPPKETPVGDAGLGSTLMDWPSTYVQLALPPNRYTVQLTAERLYSATTTLSLEAGGYYDLDVEGKQVALQYFSRSSGLPNLPPPGMVQAEAVTAKTAYPTEAVATASAVEQEIAEIRSARHGAMPPAQATAAALGGETSMMVENGTSYVPYLYLSGPVSKKVEIVAGGSQALRLPPGHYEIAAKVSNPAVIPFYGEDNYGANTQYASHFYLSSQHR